MQSSIPYSGKIADYSYEWLRTKDRLYHDYIITNPDGVAIKANGLTQSEAYKMSLDPKAFYEHCIKENTM